MGEVTIAVATYGDEHWLRLARERAIPSAVRQANHGTQISIVSRHRETLCEARNAALDAVETEFVIFLDADDELAPGYVDAMLRGTADVRGPTCKYIRKDGVETDWQPRVTGHEHDCEAACLREGNWLLIGSMARTQLLHDVGGWREWPIWEDWDLWLRCYMSGATFEFVPDAYYRAYVDDDSRNRKDLPRGKMLDIYDAIRAANDLPKVFS